MKFEIRELKELVVNFDRKRKPLSSRQRSEKKGIYPYYGATSIIDYVDDYIFDGKYILMGEDGTVIDQNGKPILQIVEGKFWCNNHAHILQNTEFVTFDYLYYLLKNTNVKSLVTGAVQPKISQSNMNKLSLKIHRDKSEQKRIARYLKVLDDKIELNNAINNNLAEQIKTICTAWLSDYVPFGGVMPPDWSETPLADIAKFISGYSYKGNELTESTIAMATIKNFDRKGGFKLDGYKEIIPSSKLKNTQHADLFDTLVAHTDLTQNAEVIGNAEPLISKSGYKDIVFSMDLVKVLPKTDKISKFLIAAILQDRKFKAHCLGYVNGTTVLHLSKKALPEYKLFLPKDLSELKPLDEVVTALYQQISTNILENTHLEKIRDILLPKLMSGELDVSDIDI